MLWMSLLPGTVSLELQVFNLFCFANLYFIFISHTGKLIASVESKPSRGRVVCGWVSHWHFCLAQQLQRARKYRTHSRRIEFVSLQLITYRPWLTTHFTDKTHHLAITVSAEGYNFLDEPVFNQLDDFVSWYTSSALPIPDSLEGIVLQFVAVLHVFNIVNYL